jgi:hypothetical protein
MDTVKQDALDLAEELSRLEVDNSIAPDNAFHAKLRECLHRHADRLGLSEEDLVAIDGHADASRAAFGGEPKPVAPDGE